MSAYSQPTENLADFNNIVFTDANDDKLTLTKANSLFLGRTGTPLSVATATTFNGDITSNSVTVGTVKLSSANNSAYFTNYTTARNRAIIIGETAQGTDDCVSIGYNANGSGNQSVAVGRSAYGGANTSTAIGSSSSASALKSTAIGSGATTSTANEICLGTTTETVNCVGTTSSISLKTASNISVNGMVFGTGSLGVGNGNIFIGQTSGTNGNGVTNTVVGNNAFTSAINTSSTGNTFIGSNAGKDITATVTTCTIVGQGSYTNTAAAYNGASCLGYDCQIGGANSTAIGTGAATGGANQIVLGRSSETVYCPGTGTSLIATKNISVNGIQVGIGSEAIGNANIYIGLGSGGSGSSNTLIGRNSWSANGVSGNSGNTIVGAQLGFNLSSSAIVSNNTVIGYNSYNTASQVAYNNVCSIGVGNVVGGNNTSLLGTSTTASGANSTAVGYGANATQGNQIMLGTSTEFVECPGTNTTNGSLKLNGGLILQTSYGTIQSTMLGYKLSTTTLLATVTGATGGVALNVLSNTIPTIGIYLCEASIYYNTSAASYYVFCSISTTSATLNSNNQTNVFTSAAVQTNQVVRTTAVITTTSANTVLYAVGQSGAASQTIASGFLQFTRIA